ncbi:hypothetical protein BDV11DRAFT_67164 [Aspergillus similis]
MRAPSCGRTAIALMASAVCTHCYAHIADAFLKCMLSRCCASFADRVGAFLSPGFNLHTQSNLNDCRVKLDCLCFTRDSKETRSKNSCCQRRAPLYSAEERQSSNSLCDAQKESSKSRRCLPSPGLKGHFRLSTSIFATNDKSRRARPGSETDDGS